MLYLSFPNGSRDGLLVIILKNAKKNETSWCWCVMVNSAVVVAVVVII